MLDPSALILPVAIAAVAIIIFVLIYRKADRVGRARLMFLTVVTLIVFLFGYSLFGPDPVYNRINRGLDLQGGIHVLLEAQDTPDMVVDEAAMRQSVDIIRERIDKLGVSEPVIQREGARRIIVELPGLSEVEQALDVIGRPAFLEFKDEAGETVITGNDLKRADIGRRTQLAEEYVVTLELSPEGAKSFAEATTANVQRRIFILLDGQVISAPIVIEPILDGSAQITGFSTPEEAYAMSVMLNSGALPVKLEIVENRSVSGTLGEDSMARSLRAAGIGTGAVLLFMLAYYRLPGLMADLALFVYTMVVLAVLAAINATLTLPGIAGLILSIGMAVDANVIIFEGIKEELRQGKTAWASVDSGFRQAFRAIVDANVTTLIAAAVLFYLGAGPIRGFAVTLSTGLVTSMLTAIVVTKYLMRLMIGSRWAKDAKVLLGVKS
jgi:preprotein translocase subunit SecD